MKYKIEKTEKAESLTCFLDPENELIYLSEVPLISENVEQWQPFHLNLFIVPIVLELNIVEKFLKDNEIILNAIMSCYKGKKWNGSMWLGTYDSPIEKLFQELTWRFSIIIKNKINYEPLMSEFFDPPDNK